MSVYIKGMEMPTSCFECKLLDYTDTYKCRVRFESLAREHGINISRPDWCPLVPVPEHGDLIGREWLIDIALHLMNTAKNEDIANGVKWLWQYIIEAPTIISADKEGEG